MGLGLSLQWYYWWVHTGANRSAVGKRAIYRDICILVLLLKLDDWVVPNWTLVILIFKVTKIRSSILRIYRICRRLFVVTFFSKELEIDFYKSYGLYRFCSIIRKNSIFVETRVDKTRFIVKYLRRKTLRFRLKSWTSSIAIF